jgi:hypothetical protein
LALEGSALELPASELIVPLYAPVETGPLALAEMVELAEAEAVAEGKAEE